MEGQNSEVIKTSDWFVTILITSLPLIGIIMLFVWAFGAGTPETKANWAKAQLIWIAIAFAIGIFFFMIFGAAILAGMANY